MRPRFASSPHISPHLLDLALDLACPLNPQHILHACQYSEYSRRVDNAL